MGRTNERLGRLFAWIFVILTLAAVVGCGQDQPNAVVSAPIARGLEAAELYVEPDDGSLPVIRFIGSAHQTLDVAMYLLSDRDVIRALEGAQKRGVRVRTMLEEHPYGTGPGNQSIESGLRFAKIITRWSPGAFRLSHDKYSVADGKTALVGTANWTHSAFVSNREYLIVVSGPKEVQQLQRLFDADWNREPAIVENERLVVSPVNSRSDFLSLIGSARTSIDLEAEEMQDSAVETALSQAKNRGVSVRVILPAASGGRDANAPGEAALSAHGVQVRRLQDPYVHAKDIVVDAREAFVGSENISTASLDDNREVGLLVEDPAVISRLDATFAQDWAAATH